MSNTLFLHVADVHLDSPLDSLRRLDSATADRMQRASRRSLENVVAAAIENAVSAVVIAGDLFDGPVKDASAGLWVESQLKRLTREGIRVVLIRGNHDSISNARRIIRWSDGIEEFGSQSAESLLLDNCGLAIHGQSFGARAVTEDLAANYPATVPGYFNVGLLHTSLSGNAQHDTYAPTNTEILESKGYQYWALGHVHVRSESSLSSKCYIGYSGNTQGRHIRETGAKGCHLVQVRDGQLQTVQFIPTDSLRWCELQLDIASIEYLADIEDVLVERLAGLSESADGRPLAVRVRLKGPTTFHSELMQTNTIAGLADNLATRMKEYGDLWLELLKIDSQPAQAATSDDLLLPLSYLCKVAEETRASTEAQQEMLQVLEELLRKSRSELSEVNWPLVNPQRQTEELTRLLHRAESLVAARLMIEGTV